MIFYQNKKQTSLKNVKNDSMKNILFQLSSPQTQAPKKQNKQKQKIGCFCFRSERRSQFIYSSNPKFVVQDSTQIKNQALNISKLIASSSFKNMKQFATKQKKSPDDILQIEKQGKVQKLDRQDERKKQKGQEKNEKERKPSKQQFSMSRLTFSAVNRSYEKNSNTVVTNESTCYSTSSNLMSSLVSHKKTQSPRAEKQQEFNNSYFGNRSCDSIPLVPKRKTKAQKTQSEFQPIKQQVQELQPKRYKFIKIKARDLGKKPTNPALQKIHPLNLTTQFQIETEINQNQKIKYDHSQIIMDFFNPGPQVIAQIESGLNSRQFWRQKFPNQDKAERDSQNKHFHKEGFKQSQNSFDSSNCGVNSNIKRTSLLSSVSQSNLSSASLSNYSQFSCSFGRITRAQKQSKWRNQNTSEGYDLSCISQNQQCQPQRRN